MVRMVATVGFLGGMEGAAHPQDGIKQVYLIHFKSSYQHPQLFSLRSYPPLMEHPYRLIYFFTQLLQL